MFSIPKINHSIQKRMVIKNQHCNKLIATRRKVISGTENIIIDNNIIFDYIDLYSKYVCSTPSMCSTEMIIPSIQEQYDILKNYYNIIHHLHNTHHLDGVILELLITDKKEALDILINSIDEYNNSTDMINNIVELTKNKDIILEKSILNV
jgi:hypothetical protein